MRKFISFFCVLILSLVFVSGCGKNIPEQIVDKNKISIVVTTFPIYDWCKQIIGENSDIELTMLIDDGIDLHSYQPSADDIRKVLESDLFIFIGGESDEKWVNDLIDSTDKKVNSLNLLDVLGEKALEEELVEGMEDEEEEDMEGEMEEEIDEHIWLSLKNAKILCLEIEKAIELLDSENSENYRNNLEDYLVKLNDLDSLYSEAFNESSINTFVFGDRFPFRYLFNDYNLNYYAAFKGCSAETEASFETIGFLSNKVDELDLKYIFAIEGTNNNICDTIISTSKSNPTKLELNSMQSITSKDKDDLTYLQIMESNLNVLKEAMR